LDGIVRRAGCRVGDAGEFISQLSWLHHRRGIEESDLLTGAGADLGAGGCTSGDVDRIGDLEQLLQRDALVLAGSSGLADVNNREVVA
jgi:hypothetical protein